MAEQMEINQSSILDVDESSTKVVELEETDQENSDYEDELSTEIDVSDEFFYETEEVDQSTSNQPYIDEPLTPSDDVNPNFHYIIFSHDQFYESMLKYVQEAKDVLNLSLPMTIVLLKHFKWDLQRMLEEFYEKERRELFQQAKLIDPENLNQTNDEIQNMCSICYSDEPDTMFHLQCHHQFCQVCWQTYITCQINQEGRSETIFCPETECQVLIDDLVIEKFINNEPFLKHIYKKLMLNSFVDSNPRARWCPGKGCGYIVNAKSLTSAYHYAQLINCTNCKMKFCFQCAQPWHDPIKCKLLLQWNKKLFDENQTIRWISQNTKKCPKCEVNIEKNGGCNHMSCTHCKHEFCWLCSKKWSTHTDCNRFNADAEVNTAHEKYIAAHTRYMHYYDRFRNHERSCDLEYKLSKKVQKRIKHKKMEISPSDIKIIKKAFDILIQCRQMLTYTYPFAYYLIASNQSIVFEQNQADVERACEELSRLLEKELFNENVINEIRKSLSEKSQYCHLRKTALLEHVKEGYTQGYWEYMDPVEN